MTTPAMEPLQKEAKNTTVETCNGNNVTYCEACNLNLSSNKNYRQHIEGKRHRKNTGQQNVTGNKKVLNTQKATKCANSSTMSAPVRGSNSSSHKMKQKHGQNVNNFCSKYLKGKNNSRHLGSYPNYSGHSYDSAMFPPDSSYYEDSYYENSYYGHWEENEHCYPFMPYNFGSHHDNFDYGNDGFNQNLNNSVESSFNNTTPNVYDESIPCSTHEAESSRETSISVKESSYAKFVSEPKISVTKSPLSLSAAKFPFSSKSYTHSKSPLNSNLISSSKSNIHPTSPSSLKSPLSSKSPSSSKSPLNSKSSFGSKSPSSSKSPLNSKSSSGFKSPLLINYKTAKLKKQLDCAETSKESCNVPEIADGDKTKEQKSTLATDVASNATRFVYPSTQKDKAVVGHLLHQLHRSKKKQNLTRLKIQSGCLEVTNKNVMLVENTQNSNSDVLHKESETLNTSSDELLCNASKEMYGSANLHHSSIQEEIEIDSSIQEANVCESKNKNQNKKVSTSNSHDLTITVHTDNIAEMDKKRKRKNSHSRSPKAKCQKCSDVNCFDSAINEALITSNESKGSCLVTSDPPCLPCSPLHTGDVSAFLAASDQHSSVIKDKTVTKPNSSEGEMQVKAEPSDAFEKPSKSCEFQNADLPAISSLDSLINLFASGSVKVKQEFEDPLIDAIKTVDPTELVKACENDPTMKQMSNLIERNFLNQAYETNIVKRPYVRAEDPVKMCDDNLHSTTSAIPNMQIDKPNICKTIQTPVAISEVSDVVSETKSVSKCVGSGNLVDKTDVIQTSNVTQKVTNTIQGLDMNLRVVSNNLESFSKETTEVMKSNLSNITQRVTNTNQGLDMNLRVVSNNLESFSEETTEDIKSTASDCDLKQSFPQMENLVEELKTLSSMEATVKKNILLADENIAEHQRILEEWKSKKLQYQTKEEELRIKRNNVIQLMQVVLGTTSESSFPVEISSSFSVGNIIKDSATSNPENSVSQSNILEKESGTESTITSDSFKIDVDHHLCEKTLEKKKDSLEIEPDVCILGAVEKKNNFPVIDLEVENQEQRVDGIDTSKLNTITNIVDSSRKTIFDQKLFPAHKTIVNCVKVHGGYLYTCCNDSTAKRFCLDNITEVVTYRHRDKNVFQLCVDEKVNQLHNIRGQVIVFTACTAKSCVSLFVANVGNLLKKYYYSFKINCICIGWNLCYVALANGSVTSVSSKEERVVIKRRNESLVCLSTAHQGGIRVLVILSVTGVFSIHNAATGLLIRCLKDILKPPARLSVFNDYAYCSSANKISILNISTGRIEGHISLRTPITGLAINKDFIFTSSFDGAIQSYPIKNEVNSKPRTIANCKAVTCIEVYKNWVFTGNRTGEVIVTKFSDL